MKSIRSKVCGVIELINQRVGKWAFLCLVGSAVLTVLLWVIGLAAWANLFIGVLVSFILQLLMFVVLKASVGEKYLPWAARLLWVGLAVVFASLIQIPFLALSKAVAGSSGGMKACTLLFGFLSFVLTFALAKSDHGKKVSEAFKAFDIKSVSENEPQPGDVIICLDKEATEKAGKPVPEILPHKDRYLHMLILGATGTGKTSQMLLPMINQDLQNNEMGVTIIEPKGDLVRQAAMLAEHYGRPYFYFDPSIPGCPFFNPLYGDESEVVENMATTFRMLNPSSSQYFLDLDEQVCRYTVKVLKRLDAAEGVDGKWATLVNFGRVIQNSGSSGKEIINKFRTIAAPTEEEGKENFDIASWFLNDYYAERSKTYQDSSELRTQVAKLNSNKDLRAVLNPDFSKGETNQVDFAGQLANGGVLCMSTAQGALGDLGKFLGYFIILQLQSAVFRRPGNEDTRRPHALYIDEFQTYSTPGFSNMLTQGRSYRVACILATQNRGLMAMGGGKDGKNFVELVSTNARNVVIFPGGNGTDLKYYSDEFGTIEVVEEMKSISRKKFNLLTGGLDRLGHPSESIREQSREKPRFTPHELRYRPFGEVIYNIIKHNTLQEAKVGTVSFIPKELHDEIEERIKVFLEERTGSANGPKSGSDITWEDADEPEGIISDIAGGEELQLPDEDSAPYSAPNVPSGRMPTYNPPPEVKYADPEQPPEPAAEPERAVQTELDWDLLDTSGDPEDGFEDEDEEEEELADDDILGG